jgi:hypothetical protein
MQEMDVIAVECADVLHTLADSIRNMRKFPSEDILCRAEEAALALQNKIHNYSYRLLGRGAGESPRYPFYGSPSNQDGDPWTGVDTPATENSVPDEGRNEVFGNTPDQSGQSYKSPLKNLRFSSDTMDGSLHIKDYPVPSPFRQQHDQNQYGDRTGTSSIQDNTSSSGNETEQPVDMSSRQAGAGFSHSLSGNQFDLNLGEIDYSGKQDVDSYARNLRIDVESSDPSRPEATPSNKPAELPPDGWKQSFIQRRASLGHNWEGTLERISALSLVKFAALLIEIVAKMKFVVDSVDELCQAARFEEPVPEDINSVI